VSPDVTWYDWDSDNESHEAVEARRRKLCPRLTASQLPALWQLRMTIWDGYVISKTARNQLIALGLAARLNGWQFITREGMAVLDVYGLLENEQYGIRGTTGDKLWTLKPEQFARLREEGWLR